MAVIGEIRKRSGLLIFLIGASIVGFLIMDATNSQFSVLKGRSNAVAKVNGEKININDFTKKYEENVKMTEDQMRNQPNGGQLSDRDKNSIRLQTWDEMVNNIIFDKVYADLGINVTPQELNELATGQYISPILLRIPVFKDQNGQYDPNRFRMFLSQLDRDQEGAEPGSTRRQWLKIESAIKQSEFQEKYNTLIAKGLYIPSWMGEMAYNDQNRLVDFKYVHLSYNDINDADIKVTDEDIKKYLDEHSNAYKQDDETRKISYVGFDLVPSSADTAKTAKQLEDKIKDFQAGKTASEDSIFVRLNQPVAVSGTDAQNPFDGVYYEKSKITSSIKDSLFSLKVGSVIGPYLEDGYFKLAKISDRKLIADSIRVRQITFSLAGINPQDPNAQAQAQGIAKLADSVFRMIDTLHADFATLAAQYSADSGRAKGGDIGWVKQNEKDKPYNDLLFFHGEKGKTYKIWDQNFGAVHIVQIIDEKATSPAVLVSYLSNQVAYSDETRNNIYAAATNFAADNQTAAKFKAAGEKLHMRSVPGIKKEAFDIGQDLINARDLVKWAYTASKGDVSRTFTVGNKYVVAILDDVMAKGAPQVEAFRDIVKPEVIREKKYEMLAKKVSDAKAAGIDDLASKLGRPAEEADKVSFANPSLGEGRGHYAPVAVATALATPAGKLSGPVKEKDGIYVVQTIAVQEPVKATDYSIYTSGLKQQVQYKAGYAQEVEKKLSKIDDNRSDFF